MTASPTEMKHSSALDSPFAGDEQNGAAKRYDGAASRRYLQVPVFITAVPARAASHTLPYSLPSHPQTGLYSSVQTSGRGLQIDVASPAPHFCSGL